MNPVHSLMGGEAWGAVWFSFSLGRGGFRGPFKRASCVFQAGREHHSVLPPSCQQCEEVEGCSQGTQVAMRPSQVEQATREPGPSWGEVNKGRDPAVRASFE